MDDNNKKAPAENNSGQQGHAAAENNSDRRENTAHEKKKGSQDKSAANRKKINQERNASEKRKGNPERAASDKRRGNQEKTSGENKTAGQEKAAAEKKKGNPERAASEKKEAALQQAEEKKNVDPDQEAPEKNAEASETVPEKNAEASETVPEKNTEFSESESAEKNTESSDNESVEKKAESFEAKSAEKKAEPSDKASTGKRPEVSDKAPDEKKGKTEGKAAEGKKAADTDKKTAGRKTERQEPDGESRRTESHKRAEPRKLSSTQVKINSFFDRLRDDRAFMQKVSISVVAVLLLVVIIIAVSTGNKSENAQVMTGDSETAQLDEQTAAAESDSGDEEVQETGIDASDASADVASDAETAQQEMEATDPVNDLIKKYFDAMASGDTDAITAIKGEMTEEEKLQIQKKSNYINSFENINVLTKDGPEDQSYIVFVYYEISFKDIDTLAPGLTTLYICKNDEGQLQIYDGELDETVTDYIKNVASADDVVEIFDRVEVKYNEATDSDATLKSFMESLPATLEQEVAQAMSESHEDETAENTEETTAKTEKVITTDTVNVRSSDSENADKLGKLEEGTTVTRYEAKQNGWSRIDYNGTEAYVKSEFVKVAEQTEETDGGTQQAETTQDSNQDVETVSGKIVVLESVNVRKSPSEQADRIGTAYQGEYYDLIMEQADGWTKIKFNGEIGYVKSEYVKK